MKLFCVVHHHFMLVISYSHHSFIKYYRTGLLEGIRGEVPVSVCLKQLHCLIVKACSVGFCTVSVYFIDCASWQER